MKKYRHRKYLCLLILLVIPFVVADLQEFPIQAEGTCHDYVLTINVVNTPYEKELGSGCWDVKIDAPGEILIDNEWTDTFFYANHAMCNGFAKLNVRFFSSSDVTGLVKFRFNSATEQINFTVKQNCGQLLDDKTLLIAVSGIILLLFGAAYWYKIK